MQAIALAELDALHESRTEWALLDVREAGEADRGHLFGATFLPRRQIELRLGDLVPDRMTTLVLYDEGGPRAALAAATLERLGYRNVRVLSGGTAAWLAAGRSLTTGSNVPSKLFGELVHEHDHVPQLSAGTLKAWQDAGRAHLVCDIRTPDEYAVARIPGAYGAFGVDLARLGADLRARAVPIVVHCAGRTRSIIACQSLRALGVPDVYALENGTMGWQLAGFALEKGPGRAVLEPSPASAAEGELGTRTLAAGVGVQSIDASGVEAWRAERAGGTANVYLLDVRQLAEYTNGHIAGSIAVPGGLAIQRTDEFAPVRNARIVLIDDREARAHLTAYWLHRAGRDRVYVFKDGIEAWRASGRELVQGRGRSEPLGWHAAQTGTQSITCGALAAAQHAPLVIDVDTSRYFKAARVPGARWVPYGWLETRIATHASALDASIVLTCHDGVLSTFAAANLARLGYTSVCTLQGGVAAWTKQGLPTERGWPAGAPDPHDIVLPPYDSSLESMARYLEWEQRLTEERRAKAAGR